MLRSTEKFIKITKRFFPLTLILIGIFSFYFLGLYKYLSFESLKIHHDELKAFISKHPLASPLLYMLLYATCVSLSLPVGAPLSFIGGYLFPQPLCTLYVVFSATCGAIVIFLAMQTACGSSLEKKASSYIKKMEKGFQDNATYYLLFLRIVPIFPFWIVNIVAALFKAPLQTFIWTTFIGSIPGTFAYTLAGRGLEKIFETSAPFSIKTAFNPQVLIALILLGLLTLAPILYRKFKKTS